jgi:anti-sigma factor RsiW
MTHLSDDLLNEYLDEALARESRTAAESHLAACPDCSARLAELRALFADLGSLPDLPLEVDFAPLILARLEQNAPLPRPVRWLTVVQAIGAVLAAVLAWPLAETMLPAWNLPPLQNISSALANSLLQTVSDFRFPKLVFDLPSLNLDLPTTTLTVTILGVALLWLVANGLLLIPRSRRTS